MSCNQNAINVIYMGCFSKMKRFSSPN